MVSMKESPSKAVSHQDSSDVSPQPRTVSGTLPPQAAHAPEFVPGDQKKSESGSDQEMATRKKTKKPTKAEKEAEEKAQKQQAMDEEWWSDDEIFCPSPEAQGSSLEK